MKKITPHALIMLFGFSLMVSNRAAAQPRDTQSYAYVAQAEKLYATTKTSTQSAKVFTELSPEHTAACLFDQKSKILVFVHSLPRFTNCAVIHIQDFTGRTIRSIKLDPKEVAGSEIPLGDLLSGSYQYLLTLDTGRKIQGSFEISE